MIKLRFSVCSSIVFIVAGIFLLCLSLFAQELHFDYRIEYDDEGNVRDIRAGSIVEEKAEGNVEDSADEEGQAQAEEAAQAESHAGEASQGSGHKVKVYTFLNDPTSQLVKNFLNKHGIQFQEIDVTYDEDALKEMNEVSGQSGISVTVIDGEALTGFNQSKMKQLLGIGWEYKTIPYKRSGKYD